MSKITFNYDEENNNDIILNKPAFLIGNGINYVDGYTIAWKDLLLQLFPDTNSDSSIIKIINGKKTFNLDGLTYPEIAELAELYSNLEKDNDKEKLSVKKHICQIVHENDKKICESKQNLREKQNILISNCKSLDIPILTTNYDHSLLFNHYKTAYVDYISGGIEDLFWIFNEDKEPKSKNKYPFDHLFNAYFRNYPFEKYGKIDVREEFAIWPIHGSKRYSSSLIINNMDYAKTISEINKRIDKKENMFLQSEQWNGKYTWLNIFLHNDLIILGLGLDSNETDLRWLLVERYIYQKWIKNHYPSEKCGEILYLYTERLDTKTKKLKTIENGKKCFFESLGIKCIKIDADKLYKFKYLKEFKI